MPMLDIVIVDSLGLIGQNITILDGTIISCNIWYGDPSTSVPLIPFKVASVSPSKTNKTATYTISAFFQSDLLYCTSNWSFGGTITAAFQNIFVSEPVQLPLNISIKNPVSSVYYKPANESFAHYFRRVLWPSFPQTNTTYYLYYHGGNQIIIQDVLANIRNYNTNQSGFKLTSNNFVDWTISSNSFHKNMGGNAYGVNSYQYNVDTSEYENITGADSYIKYNKNQDINVQHKSIFLSSSQGNTPVGYNQNGISNLANSGIMNVEAEVTLNYPSGTTGLQVIPFFYEDSKYIPFVLAGKSRIIHKGMYLEKLHIISNTIDESVLSSLG